MHITRRHIDDCLGNNNNSATQAYEAAQQFLHAMLKKRFPNFALPLSPEPLYQEEKKGLLQWKV